MTQLIARTFGDPQSSAKLDVDALVADGLALASPPAFLADLTVATMLPSVAPQGRLVVVRAGLWLEYQPPITAVNRLRIVVWDLDADASWDIASWLHAQLLAMLLPSSSEIHSYRYDGGPTRGLDPDYGTPITAFTLRARMRNQPLDAAPRPGGYGNGGYGE
jgi:hypothetical protein